MYPNYTRIFLNLEGVSIKKVIHADSFIKIFIETKPSEQTCPCCGRKTARIHDYRNQVIKDIPSQAKLVSLVLRKRRMPVPVENASWNPIPSCLSITAGQNDWTIS